MSIAWTPEFPSRQRGAAPVGTLAELPGVERRAVLYLRKWCEGPQGREAVAADVSRSFDAPRAAQTVNRFADLLEVVLRCPRRPLMRHGSDCGCFGGDESTFAHMIAASAAGDREDAMAFALTLMHPGEAFQAVQVAEDVGLSFLELSRPDYARPPYLRH
ncbi:hypothetical protein EOK75_18310 (plasmid) [Pseudorhodobacter turbinis]|uniref:Uncharacterized protein n=1 Tax=Pseudorhodobacter turbinis TaxID=2500533 RepID=A0A4P8EKQ5_9RHOB|nr:hypothetical protein [Pseudorhodobacter turbinis]QCO57647.1 hypothetical protein EOK75_18310 [Pseudorhodobacter turbinis]